MSDEPTLWSAAWCGPCKGLKVWISQHYPQLPVRDIDEGGAPFGLKSVPALEVNGMLVVGSKPIQEWLVKYYDE